MNALLRCTIALGAAFSLVACSTGLPPAPPPVVPVRVLGINDVYVADTLTDGTGGLSRVATLRARLKDAGPVLFVLPGDFLSPSVLSKYYRGAQMVEGLNAAGLDYATFGNHEFELPRDTLVARIAESKFTWLSSNCTEASGQPFPGVRVVDTVRLAAHKVGLFALTLPGKYASYVRCANPDSAATRAVDSLTALGVDLIIGVTHQALGTDYALLQRELRIDLIVGGHEHEAHDSIAGGRHVVKAASNARSAQLVTLWGGKGKWRQEPRLIRIDRATPPDAATEAVTRRWADSLAKRLGVERTVGRAVLPIDARDEPQRRMQTKLGNLLTDAMRTGTGADLALLNSGTLRLDDVIPAGPISSWTLESIFLFADETRIVKVPLTGARVRELLEHGVLDGSHAAGPYPQVAGLMARYDPTQPEGRRLIGDVRRSDGSVLRPTDAISVALPVYLACSGGDGYDVPEAKLACAERSQAPRAAVLLTAYIERTLQGVVDGPPEDRLVRSDGR